MNALDYAALACLLFIAFKGGKACGEMAARDRLERAISARKPTIHYNEETDDIWVETAHGREHF